MNQLLEQEQM